MNSIKKRRWQIFLFKTFIHYEYVYSKNTQTISIKLIFSVQVYNTHRHQLEPFNYFGRVVWIIVVQLPFRNLLILTTHNYVSFFLYVKHCFVKKKRNEQLQFAQFPQNIYFFLHPRKNCTLFMHIITEE